MSEQELVEKWRDLFNVSGPDIDRLSDHGGADWESLCVGFCLANGLTVEHAFDFYQKMIPLGLF